MTKNFLCMWTFVSTIFRQDRTRWSTIRENVPFGEAAPFEFLYFWLVDFSFRFVNLTEQLIKNLQIFKEKSTKSLELMFSNEHDFSKWYYHQIELPKKVKSKVMEKCLDQTLEPHYCVTKWNSSSFLLKSQKCLHHQLKL